MRIIYFLSFLVLLVGCEFRKTEEVKLNYPVDYLEFRNFLKGWMSEWEEPHWIAMTKTDKSSLIGKYEIIPDKKHKKSLKDSGQELTETIELCENGKILTEEGIADDALWKCEGDLVMIRDRYGKPNSIIGKTTSGWKIVNADELNWEINKVNRP